MRCVIFSSSKINDYNFVKKLLEPDDFIICADGGYRHAVALAVTPDLIIGDMDSCTLQLPGNVEVKKCSPIKDETDTFMALKEGLSRGFCDFLLFGAMGGRLDHTIANISLLLYALQHNANAVMYDERTEVKFLRPGKHVIDGTNAQYFSLFAFDGAVKGITLTGAKYPLYEAQLECSVALGISNEFLERQVEISFVSGSLLVIVNRNFCI